MDERRYGLKNLVLGDWDGECGGWILLGNGDPRQVVRGRGEEAVERIGVLGDFFCVGLFACVPCLRFSILGV